MPKAFKFVSGSARIVCTYLTLVVRIVSGIKGIPFDCKTFKNSLGVVEMFVL